jgi:hypothetical protein
MVTFLVLQYDNRKLDKDSIKLMNINKKYCLQYNYDYVFIKKQYDLPPYWIKVYLLQHFLQTKKYKGILWLDMDACIHNFDICLEDILIKNKSFYKSPDNKIWKSSFNAGVFLVLNNEIGLDIMNDWMKCYNKNEWHKNDRNNWTTNCKWAGICYEQGSFEKIISPKYKKYIHTFNWSFFQSFYSNLLENENRCVFTLHFAGDKIKKEIPYYLKSLKNKKGNQNTNSNTRKNHCKFLKNKTRKRTRN